METSGSNQPFELTASVPIAGPYNVPKAWDSWFFNPPGCCPLAVHLILAYRYIYGFNNALSDLFKPPYDSQVLNIEDGTNDGNELAEMLPQTMQGLLQPTFIGEVRAGTHPFGKAMAENIIDDFAPVTPTRLYHGKSDELVPYAHSVESCNKMKALGATDIELVDVGSGYTHVESFVPSVIRAKFWFDSFLQPQ